MAKKEKNYKFRIISTSYLIDISIVVLLFTIILLNWEKVLCFELSNFVGVNVIISLLPAVITIIALSLEFQNDLIRGIRVKDFNKLRGPLYYNLLHMVVIIICIFLLELLLSLFSLNESILFLDIASFIYTVIFMVQEIPILMRNDWYIDHVLKHNIPEPNIYHQEIQSSKEMAFVWSIAYYGIRDCYNKFKTADKEKNSDLLLNLLHYEYIFFVKYSDYYSTKHVDVNQIFGNIDIVKAFKNSFRNILDLLNEKGEFSLNKIYIGDDGLFFLIRNTYTLHILALKTELDDKKYLVKIIDNIVLSRYSKDDEDVSYVSTYITTMAFSTLRDGETWFVKAIRDQSYAPISFDVADDSSSVLISMYISFILNSVLVDDKKKDIIRDFVDEPESGLNGTGLSWREKIKSAYDNLNSGKILLDSFANLYSLKKKMDEQYFYLRVKPYKAYFVDDSYLFSDELLMDYFFEILLTGDYYDLNEHNIHEFLDCLIPEDKDKFVNMFNKRWTDLSKRKNDKSHFINFLDNNDGTRYYNEKAYNIFDREIMEASHDGFYSNPSNFISNDLYKRIKNNIDENIPILFNNLPFYDYKIPANKMDRHSFTIRLSANGISSLLDSSIKYFKSIISNIICNEIDRKIASSFYKNTPPTKEDIDRIIEFNPRYSSNLYSIKIYADEHQLEKLNQITELSRDILPRDVYLKDGAVNLKFEYIKDDSVPEKPSRSQIEEIINNEYELINGFYRLNNYDGQYRGKFLVSREELIEILENSIVFVKIAYLYSINVDEKLCLRFKQSLD